MIDDAAGVEPVPAPSPASAPSQVPAPAHVPPTVPVRRHRLGAAVTAVLLLLLVAGDLALALGLPVLTSTCADRLCGPPLAVGAAAGGVAVVAVVAWLVGDVLRDRGRGLWLCWTAVAVVALPWAFLVPALRWWTG